MKFRTKTKKRNNYERIKGMSLDELAALFADESSNGIPSKACYICPFDQGLWCGNADGECTKEERTMLYKAWLLKEAK